MVLKVQKEYLLLFKVRHKENDDDNYDDDDDNGGSGDSDDNDDNDDDDNNDDSRKPDQGYQQLMYPFCIINWTPTD
jgi:hypothetical protein